MPTSKANTKAPQTFIHHIHELRRRIFLIAVVGLVAGSLVYYYHDFFVRLVMAPLGDQKLVYLTPVGGFSFVFMVTFYITLLLVLPFVLYQVYAFLKPAVPSHTTKLSILVGVTAAILMVAGASFGYFFAVPGGLNFLSGFGAEYVTPSLTADAYLRFVLGYVLGMGLLFQLPLLLLFWHWIHPLTPKGLLNSERYIIVAAFVAAAIISPTPDALTQTIIALPIIVVYQFGVVAVLVIIRKKRHHQKVAQGAPIQPVKNEGVKQGYSMVIEKPTGVARGATLAPRPQRIKSHSSASLDGMRPAKKVTQSNQAVLAQGRAQLMVPSRQVRRQRLVSDFVSVRQSKPPEA